MAILVSLASRARSLAFSLASYAFLSLMLFLFELRKYLLRIFFSLALSIFSGFAFFTAASLAFFFFINQLIPKEASLLYWIAVAAFFLSSAYFSVVVSVSAGLLSFLALLIFQRRPI